MKIAYIINESNSVFSLGHIYAIKSINQQIDLSIDGDSIDIVTVEFDDSNVDLSCLKAIKAEENWTIVEDAEKLALKVKENEKNLLCSKGLNARACCQTILDFIAGYNISSQFTSAQVTELVTQFSDIVTLLQLNRPISAKPLIQAVQVSETVPQYIKDHILSIIESYGY